MSERTNADVAALDLGYVDSCLAEAAHEVLETMFFVSVEGDANWADAAGVDCRYISIEFHGPLEGRMSLAASMDAAPPLAAGFSGRDESELTSEDINGVLCEMANMLCGNLLSRLENDALFSLSAPRVSGVEDGGVGVCRVFDLGIGAIRVCVSVNQSGSGLAT